MRFIPTYEDSYDGEGVHSVPRPADIIYAPIDLAQAIGEGLAKRGHEVDFYAPHGSHVQGATMKTANLRALIHKQDDFGALTGDTEKLMHEVPGLWDKQLSSRMFAGARTGKYDVLHFHHPETALGTAALYPEVPIVYTLHDPIYPWYRELFELYQTPNQYFVSISNNQRRGAPDLPYADTIYNGVNPDKYKFSETPEDYLIFAGRIVPEKGIKEAIEVAQKTNHRLLIIGPVYEDKKPYFDQYIKPHLNDKILYLGYMEQDQLVRYYQKAKAFLMPIQWEEPFGLTMIESLACGTPVIAMRRGSVPEVMVDGKTGYIVDSVGEMIEAVGKINQIDRRTCRKHVQDHFSIERMVDNYEAMFKAVIKKHNRSLPAPQAVRKTLKTLPRKLKTTLRKSSRK